MATDTTQASYWLNWRFLLCAIYIVGVSAFATFIIWRNEGKKKSEDERRERGQVTAGMLYKDEVWKPCLNTTHPVLLLGFRILAFLLLFGLIIGNAIVKGPGIFFYYTQWTFTLTTVYFGLASGISIYRCFCDHNGICHSKGSSQNVDAEQGSYNSPRHGGIQNTSILKSLCNHEEVHVRKIAGPMDYLLQIMYQMTAGAVVLTDVVFWLIIYPFLTGNDYRLHFFDVGMHSANILILGDTILNGMRFPMFRIGYFIWWTGLFVMCQWIIHACVSLSWPYPFMELASPYAPIWYAAVGLLHIPCYGIFALIVKLKHMWLSRSFPESYQGMSL